MPFQRSGTTRCGPKELAACCGFSESRSPRSKLEISARLSSCSCFFSRIFLSSDSVACTEEDDKEDALSDPVGTEVQVGTSPCKPLMEEEIAKVHVGQAGAETPQAWMQGGPRTPEAWMPVGA